jgi:hypothetical protein
MINCTAWIRPSSGQLCAELIPSNTPQPYLYNYPAGISRSHKISSISDTQLLVFESLTTEEYHNICGIHLSQFRIISISTSTTVKPGTVVSWFPGHPLKDLVEIAYAPNVDAHYYSWQTSDGVRGVAMEDGWTRYFILFFG